MRQPTNLRELPAIRDNRLFPVPVRAYDPSNRPELPEGPKLPDLPDLPAPEDFRRWGLEFTGEYTAEATPAGLSYSLPVFQDQGERWLVREHQGHPRLLIPFPIEQVAYAKEDKIFRRTSRDEASLRCGVVTTPDSRSTNNPSWCDFNNEWVRVLWDGESQDRDVRGRDIQLYRDEPLFKRP